MSKKKYKKEDPFSSNYGVKIIEIFTKYPYQYFNYKQIATRLNVYSKEERTIIANSIDKLANANILIKGGRGRYKINPIHIKADESNIITGRINMKQTGKAYLTVENSKMEDVFIAANNTAHALNGDLVKVHLFPARRAKRPEGRVIEIIKRHKIHFVGTIKTSKNISFFVPDDVSMPIDVLIPNEALHNAKDGQKVVVKLNEWHENARNPFGEVVQVLGYPGDNEVEMLSILIDQTFYNQFSEEVEKEAALIPTQIDENEILRRRDFRDRFTMTIDPADAKDFDDAISFKELDDKTYEVGIHIADVSFYVKPNTHIDNEAYKRATSVYLVDRTIPMLPEKLSNGICSLSPNEDKLCFSAVFVMDIEGRIQKQWIGKSIINSNRRFNYEEVQTIIENRKGEYATEILTLDTIAKALRKQRFEKGSINFHSEEVKFVLDEKAKPIGVYTKEDNDANHLIEDFMLLANRKVAELIGKVTAKEKAKAFIYRVHDQPLEEKINKFNEFIQRLGYSLQLTSRKHLADSINELFIAIQGKGEQKLIEQLAIRTMQRAIYSTNNIGHYGLAFKHYTHFTSPIRRYPDLMVHRLLERYMDGKPSVNKEELSLKCKHATEMEQRATDAERNSIKYKQAEYLSDKIGETFNGLISGVSKWGIWVELKESKCEGMVSVKTLTDDFYYLDEDNYRYIGQQTGKILRLGDDVNVKVRKVDIAKKQIDFIFVNDKQ
ncbi:MAG TPA: ribonuclease R [Bacteroidales bacterium]|nr:ribonuclease R [Bacteroidales bacterium]HOR82573.1 ribonuclease R [Bacteroidales bacterium]